MKKRRTAALALTAALTLSVCGTSVWATGGNTEPPLLILAPTAADPAGTLSYANLDQRVRAGSLNYLILEETIAGIEVIDYDKLKEDMKDGLNFIADQQWNVAQASSMAGNPIFGMAATSATSQSLQSSYDSLREQFDDLKDGKIQQDAADGVRQLRNTQNSIVIMAESVYAQLVELDATSAALDRSLAALDRQIRELELRHEMGQISGLTLQQAKAGRTTLVSNQRTLASSMATGLMNLEALVGAELTGALELGQLPKVTGEELAVMDLETDLAAAQKASYDLYAAQKTLEDAKEAFQDAGKDYGFDSKDYQYVQAQHDWQAAQYTYQGTVQNFELSFRSLYAQVQDYAQVLEAAKAALELEKLNYAADELKYGQGAISQNTLLTAADDLAAAHDTVATAERNLFSVYNNYRWAVDHGILTTK